MANETAKHTPAWYVLDDAMTSLDDAVSLTEAVEDAEERGDSYQSSKLLLDTLSAAHEVLMESLRTGYETGLRPSELKAAVEAYEARVQAALDMARA